MHRKVGEIFDFNDVTLEVYTPTGSHTCSGCYFWKRSCTSPDKSIRGRCTDPDIIFVEVKKEERPKNDVANPAYYGAGNGIECIDVMIQQFGEKEVQAFCKLNAFKYLFRCGNKNAPLEEMKKIEWYVKKWIELEEKMKDGENT